MTKQTSICGAILIALGVIVTIVSDSGSVTSLIPAFVGIILLALGLAASAKPAMGHHLMHMMAVIALLALLGSLGSLGLASRVCTRVGLFWFLLVRLVLPIVMMDKKAPCGFQFAFFSQTRLA